MALELYGIRQNLGVYKTLEEMETVDLPDLPDINADTYKKFKPFKIEGGVDVFRGVADAAALAKNSKTLSEYQREINSEHMETIKEYLLKSSPGQIYFPEVTLLYEYDDTLDPKDLPFQSIIDLPWAKNSNTNLLSRLYATGISIFTLPESESLYRLDGNHRLTILGEFAEGLKLDPKGRAVKSNLKKGNRFISYCIILVPKTSEFTYEHLYFYLLNSKSLPITPLKNIDLLIQEKAATDLKLFIEQDPFLHIMNSLKEYWKCMEDDEKEALIEIVKEFLKKGRKYPEITSSCQEGIGVYNSKKEQTKNPRYIGICCLLCFHANCPTKAINDLDNFFEWINKFSYDISLFSKIHDLVESFKKYRELISRKKYIFVAMQYEPDFLNQYSNSIASTILKLKGKYPHIDLELIPIMNQDNGENIINTIMEQHIPKCDIFIADLSTNNGNVLLEYGYAKAMNKFMCLFYQKTWRSDILNEFGRAKKDVNPPTHINKLYSDLEYKIFDLKMIQSFEWEAKNELETELFKRFETFIDQSK